MKRILLLSAVLVMLAGCKEDNRDRNVGVADYEIQAEGCTVKYIDNPKGYNFFIAKCPAESETVTYRRQSGKTQYTTATVVTSESLRKQLSEVEAKEAALAKLSPEDKKALGIK